MKKLYFSFIQVLLLLFAANASAEECTVTIKVTTPESVTMSLNGTPIVVQESTEVTFDPNAYPSLTINANTGYYIMGLYDNNNTRFGYGSTSSWTQNLYSTYNGAEWELRVLAEDVFKDAKCTIKVDDPTKVSITYGDYSNSHPVTDLVAGVAKEVKFNSTLEKTFTIRSSSSSSLYSVKKNGTSVPENNGSYTLTVANNDAIEVEAKFPDKDCNVKFEYANEGTQDAITSVTVDNVAQENFNKGFTCKAGQSLVVTGNTNDYNFNYAIEVNGVTTSFYGSYSTTVKDDITIKVTASKYKVYNTTVNVNLPEAVKYGRNLYDSSSATQMTQKSEVVTTTENNSAFYIFVNPTYVIKSIMAGETDLSSSYNSYYKAYTVYAQENMVVNIEAEKNEVFTATMKFNDVDAVSVNTNMYGSGTALTLMPETSVKTDSENATYYIMPKDGYYLTSLLINSEEKMAECYLPYAKCYKVVLEKDMVVEVKSAQIVRDQTLITYVDYDHSSNYTSLEFARVDNSSVTLEMNGYGMVNFAEADAPFSWRWYDSKTGNTGEAYLNDELQTSDDGYYAQYRNRTLKDGDVLKIYIGKTNVEKYNVTFTSTLNSDQYSVTKDIIKPVENATDASVQVLPGTRFTVKATGSTKLSVSVNNEDVKGAEGSFTFDVNEDSDVSINLSTAIDEISTAKAEQQVVYTIQGMRLKNGSKLGAGVYVVNGKTTIIK